MINVGTSTTPSKRQKSLCAFFPFPGMQLFMLSLTHTLSTHVLHAHTHTRTKQLFLFFDFLLLTCFDRWCSYLSIPNDTRVLSLPPFPLSLSLSHTHMHTQTNTDTDTHIHYTQTHTYTTHRHTHSCTHTHPFQCQGPKSLGETQVTHVSFSFFSCTFEEKKQKNTFYFYEETKTFLSKKSKVVN